jgi:alpha-glucosidase
VKEIEAINLKTLIKYPAALALLLGCVVLGVWLGGALHLQETSPLKGQLSFDPQQVPSLDYEVGDFIVRWRTENGGQLIVEAKNRPGFVIWQTLAGEAFLTAAQNNPGLSADQGKFNFQDDFQLTCLQQNISAIKASSSQFEITGSFLCNDKSTKGYKFSILYYVGDTFADIQKPWPGFVLDVSLLRPHEPGAKDNVFFLTYATNPDEHFFGFGEQFTYFDLKGQKVPIRVSTQGAAGNALSTAAPMPRYITSQMRAFTLHNTALSIFDLRQPDRVQIQVYSYMLNAQVFNIRNPAELLKQNVPDFEKNTLPDWVHSGAIIGMQGSTQKVREIYAKLKQRQTPVAAIWLPDWAGQRQTSAGAQLGLNWEVDNERYPGWEQLVSDLNRDGVEVMLSVSPDLVDLSGLKPNLFQEAKERGYLIKNTSGEPYLIKDSDFNFSMLDFTNPEALKWYKNILKERLPGAGAKGWLADFSVGLPADAALYHDPRHEIGPNVYLLYWADLNRAVVDETDKNMVFFSRSALTGAPHVASSFWEGDQLVDWSTEGGIKSAVTGLNTGGLSGMLYNHSAIGGYTTISSPALNIHRSRELLYRWMEMNAFTLIFRAQDGSQPENNVQFYTDDETLDTFAHWAKVYAALFEYRKSLVAEAAQTGLPVVRHPFIQYPDDPETWKITYQEFMLGADFLIAPVTDPGVTQVRVYLPKGEWTDLWDGVTYQGGQYLTAPAPIGRPCVFYVKGSTWGDGLARRLNNEGLLH